MSRLVLVLLLSTAVNAMYTEKFLKINQRFVELFNAGQFSELAEELFDDHAQFITPRFEIQGSIVDQLKNFAKYGELSQIKIIEAVKNSGEVEMYQGTSVKLRLHELIEDSKFLMLRVSFADK